MRRLDSTEYLKALIAEGEHQHQDFKFEVSDARKIARSLSAFANTSGGRLLVGVKDNGKIAGIDSDEEIYMVEAAAQVYCVPVPVVEMRTIVAEGRTVLIAEVHEAETKPVKVIGADGRKLAYLRRADENVLATSVHLRIWEQERRQHGEMVVIGGIDEELMKRLAASDVVDVDDFSRSVGVPRKVAVRAMARLVRFNVAEEVFVDHKFYWRAV